MHSRIECPFCREYDYDDDEVNHFSNYVYQSLSKKGWFLPPEDIREAVQDAFLRPSFYDESKGGDHV